MISEYLEVGVKARAVLASSPALSLEKSLEDAT
jgi:hypothetical protein